MIEIEISYDPVKMHTEIKMSSKVLKTPNHIQKYLTRPFPELLPRLPGFLHDVLNGFGFELKFTGSRVDYLSLEKTFLDAGIGPGLVRIIHVNPPPVSPGDWWMVPAISFYLFFLIIWNCFVNLYIIMYFYYGCN